MMIYDSIRQSKPTIRNNFGVGRYNTRLNFYFFEINRLSFIQRKNFYNSPSNTNETDDLGAGVKGEVSCARCGIHLGDYFDDDDSGQDHYCIDGVCMIPPGGEEGKTCPPSLGSNIVA